MDISNYTSSLVVVTLVLILSNIVWWRVYVNNNLARLKLYQDKDSVTRRCDSLQEKLIQSEESRVDDMKKLMEKDNKFRDQMLEKIGSLNQASNDITPGSLG